MLQITCDYDDDEPEMAPAGAGGFSPIPSPPVLTRRLNWLNVSQSGSGGTCSCDNVPATPPAISTVVPVEGEREGENEVASPAVAPIPPPTAPSRARGLRGLFCDMLDKSGSSGGMIASFAVIETGIIPVEGGREGGVVEAPAPAAAPPTTHKRKFSLVDFLELSGGGSFATFGLVETAMLPVEGPKEEEVVVAPVEVEVEEEEKEEEEEMPTLF